MIKVEVKDNFLIIYTPYNEDFINDIKKLKQRYWDGRAWRVQITHDKKDAIMALYLLEKHFNYTTNIKLPDIPFGHAEVRDDNLILQTEFNKNFIEQIKPLAMWDFNKKCWIVKPKSLQQIEEIEFLLADWGIKFNQDVKEWLENKKQHFLRMKELKKELLSLSKKTSTTIDIKLPPNLKLYPFQKVGVEWLEKTNGRALLADEMGLGKTIQVLAYLYNHPEIRPVIVVCPNSVKINWKREIKKWCQENAFIIFGKSGYIPPNFPFYIINYDILADRLEQLKKLNAKMVILDESHYIKNYKAKRSKASIELCKNIPHIVCLTGTPVLNRPKELWTTLQILKPAEKDLRDFWTFMKKYANARQIWVDGKLIWDFDGASNLDELNIKLRQTIMIRRLKKDVLKELPPKRRYMVPLEIDNVEEYQEAEKNFLLWYYRTHNKKLEEAELLVRVEKLRQLAVKGKLRMVVSCIENTLENYDKVVVFAHHKDIIHHLSTTFNCPKIIGGMDSITKQTIIDNFKKEGNLLLASIMACGEGVNLECANVALMVELTWTPSRLKQAEDRLHRIGQKYDVDIYYLLAENTIEEYMWLILQEKQKIIDEVVDGVEEVDEKGFIYDVVERMLLKRKERELNLIEGGEGAEGK